MIPESTIQSRLLETIRGLQTENQLLTQRLNNADAQNQILNLQVKMMTQKMEVLESLLRQLNSMVDLEVEHKCTCTCQQQTDETNEEGKDGESSEEEFDFLERPKNFCPRVKNPLYVDLILAHLMGYLTPSQLFKCRMVNKLWNEEALRYIRHKGTFNLDKTKTASISSVTADFTRIIHPDGTVDYPKLDENEFFREFIFSKLSFDVGYILESFRPQLTAFFNRFGIFITSFSLHCDEENDNMITSEELENLLLSSMPNLEYLDLFLPVKLTQSPFQFNQTDDETKIPGGKLKGISLHQLESPSGYSVAFLKSLLGLTKCLVSLSMETSSVEVVSRLLLAMAELELEGRTLRNLTELKLDAHLTAQHLEILVYFSFKLKQLQLSYFNEEVQATLVETLLGKHKDTLESLCLGDYQRRSTTTSQPLHIALPRMKKLTHFTIEDPCFPTQRQVVVTPLTFTEQLPVLKKMSFKHEDGRPAGVHLFTDLCVLANGPCLTLSTMEIHNGLTDPTLVVNIKTTFPSLINLVIRNVTDEVVKSIWRHLVRLKRLTLFLSPVNKEVDSLLTGIPEEVCCRIQENKMFSETALSILEMIRTDVSICNLAELEILSIDGNPSTLITAVTGYLAFGNMKNLRFLHLKQDVATISKLCCSVLEKKMTIFNTK